MPTNVRQIPSHDPRGVFICEVLARAIDARPEYAHHAHDEIHFLLRGRAINPKRPRKRGYTNISLQKRKDILFLQAPVQIAKGCRFVGGLLLIQGQKLPDILLKGMVGKPAQKIAEHPFLAGFNILHGNSNAKNSWFKLERKFLPLLSTSFGKAIPPAGLPPYQVETSQ